MSLFLFNCRLIESARVQLFSCRGEVEKNCRSGAAFFHGPQIVLQSRNPFTDPALSSPDTFAAQTGQVTNDVGNTVIVPKDGESFTDTMKRAAAHGKTVTQDQINKELATAPKKAATVLAAAPAIGAGGAAALAVPGEVVDFAMK